MKPQWTVALGMSSRLVPQPGGPWAAFAGKSMASVPLLTQTTFPAISGPSATPQAAAREDAGDSERPCVSPFPSNEAQRLSPPCCQSLG